MTPGHAEIHRARGQDQFAAAPGTSPGLSRAVVSGEGGRL